MVHSHNALIFTLAPIGRLKRDFERAGIDLSDSMVVPIGVGVDSDWDVDAVDAPDTSVSVEITRTRFDEIVGQVQREWLSWLVADARDPLRRYFSFLFHTTRTPVVHWRMSVVFALEKFTPIEVYLYGVDGDPGAGISSRVEFLSWAREAIVREAVPNVIKVKASRPRRTRLRGGVKNLRMDVMIDFSWSLGIKLRNVFRRSRAKFFDHFTDQRNVLLLGRPRVVVLAQRRNVSRLFTYLNSRSVSFTTISVKNTLKATETVCAKQIASTSNCSSSEIVDKTFYRLFDLFVTQLRADEEAVIAFASQPWEVLMTDHEYDPNARLLAEITANSGKSVVLIPEGVQTLSDSSVRPYFENWFWDVPSLTRFAVNEQEAGNYLRTFAAGQVVVTGYLGRSAKPEDGTIPFLSPLTGLLLRKHRDSRPMALVNFEPFGIFGLGRAGQQDLYSEIISSERLIFALTELGWSVCVTSKMPDSFEYLRSKFTGFPVWFFSGVEWQILAQACDVLIQRDSSLGPEALELNIPVLVWNECLLPLASKKCIESSNGMMTLVETTKDLGEALARALRVNQEPYDSKDLLGAPTYENLDRWLDTFSK